MENSRQRRYEKALEAYRGFPDSPSISLMIAICLTQTGDYRKARRAYVHTLKGFLKNRRGWFGTSQPNWLIDTFVMANQPRLYHKVSKEIEAYKSDYRGGSLVAHYSYAIVSLISGCDSAVAKHTSALLAKPKEKSTYASGAVIQAVIERDQFVFAEALSNLLDAHRGMAKFGGLRETPEGFLCLPGMSLSRIALERGLKVETNNEYLSTGYLQYLGG
jgi:hypothetical protein